MQSATDTEKTAAFHRQRRMFVITNRRLHLAPSGVEWGHREWFEQSGRLDLLDNATRGFFDGTGIYAYHGESFFGDVHDAQAVCEHLQEFPVDQNLFVFIGMVPGQPGERWWPVHRLGTVRGLLGK